MKKSLPFNIEEYIKILNRQPARRKEAVLAVISFSSYNDIKRYYQHTPQLFKGLFRNSFSYLKRTNYTQVFWNSPTSLLNPIDYVGMLSLVLPFYKDEINLFIKYRKAFEESYLEGRYVDAESIIERINSEVSYSAWAAVNLIKISELKGGVNSRLQTHKRFNELSAMPMFKYICDQAQESSSIQASTEMFNKNRIEEIRNQHYSQKWQEDFLIANLYPYETVGMNEWYSYSFKSSLVDLYHVFLLFLPHLIIEYKDNKSFKDYMCIILKYINDPRLDKYGAFLGLKDWAELRFTSSNTNMDYVFEECVDAASHQIDLGDANGVLLERIKYHLIGFLKNEETNLHSAKLEMIYLSNPGFHPFRRLYDLMSDLTDGGFAEQGVNHWKYSEGIGLLDSLYYDTPAERANYLSKNSLSVVMPNQVPLQLSLYNIEQILSVGDIIPYIQILEKRLLCDNVPEFSKGLIIGFLFNSYLKARRYKEAVLLYVNYKLKHPNVQPKIDKKLVEYLMVRTVDTSLDSPMELAVFYRMINGKAAKISANASRCIMNLGLDKPGDIECDGSLLILFFMDKVLDINTLELCPIFYETSLEVLRDRIDICKKLKAVTNDRKYSHEINHLITEIGIQDFLEQVECSKIDVDELLLKKHELGEAKEIFNLYKSIEPDLKVMRDDNQLMSLFPIEVEEYQKDKKLGEKTLSEVPYKLVLFTKFILALRDAFLLNDNAGLDYYLSSRVRHGTIKNQLRHHLQQHGLTTRKSEAGNYDLNIDWVEKKLGFTGDAHTKGLDAFLEFSRNVDIIINRLKDQNVQVKTELHNKNVPACFDLSLSYLESGIYNLYLEGNQSFSTVVDDAFKMFWDRVEECFAIIKDEIKKTELELLDQLDILSSRIVALAPKGNNQLSIFKDTIITCKTLLQGDCKAVSDWFQRGQAPSKPFTMEELAEASVRGINNYCDAKIKPAYNITTHTKIAGKYIGHFYAMFHDLLNNINDYYLSKKSNSSPCSILITESEGFLNIHFENHVNEEDYGIINDSINKFLVQRVQSQLGSKMRLEGNTGFSKINNIVAYFLADDGNSYTPALSGDNFVTDIKINLNNIRHEENTTN